MKRLGVDKEIYSGIYNIYHSQDLFRPDFTLQDKENFAEYIYNMYRNMDEKNFKFIPNNFANVKMSKEEVKIYTCIYLTYIGYFKDESDSEDTELIRVDNAFRVFLESELYKNRISKEDSEESYQIERYEFFKNLLSGNKLIIYGRSDDYLNFYREDADGIKIDDIKGDYLTEFKNDLEEIKIKLERNLVNQPPADNPTSNEQSQKVLDELQSIRESVITFNKELKNNIVKLEVPEFIYCSKRLQNRLKISVMSNNGTKILRVGTYELNINDEIRAIIRCNYLIGQCINILGQYPYMKDEFVKLQQSMKEIQDISQHVYGEVVRV